jgi:hypothetical protein
MKRFILVVLTVLFIGISLLLLLFSIFKGEFSSGILMLAVFTQQLFGLIFFVFFKSEIMRFSEMSFFRSKVKSPNDFIQKDSSFPILPLPRIFFVVLGLLVMYGLIITDNLNYSHSNSKEFFSDIDSILKVIANMFIAFAFFLHFRPNLKREKKYYFLLVGVAILFLTLATDSKNFNTEASEPIQGILGVWLNIFLWIIIYFGIIGVITTVFVKYKLAKKSKYPDSFILGSYKGFRLFGFPILILSILFTWPFFLIPYLMIRYILTEYMRIFPIVYLRSFHYKESTEVFADLIAPVASQFGVITCLVHEKQKGSDIFAKTHITDQGQTFTISDEYWQDWVQDKLKRCSAVIIDSSVGSESVHWEIVTANKLVDPNRIILLHKEGTELKNDEDNKELTYLLDRKSMKDARRSLKKIMNQLFIQPKKNVIEKKQISIIDILGSFGFLISTICTVMIGFSPDTIQNFFYLTVSIISILFVSSYFVYNLLSKLTNTRQKHISLLIGFTLALSLFSFNNIFRIFQIEEEKSIAWRFSLLKDTSGKGAIASDKGYIEKINEVEGARKDIRIISIKTETLEKLNGRWPIHWNKYAEIIEGFKGTKNILAFDIFFYDYKKGQMEIMESALKGSDNVLFDYAIESSGDSINSINNLKKRISKLRKYKLKNVVDKDDHGISWLSYAVPPIEQIARYSSGIGFANIRKEQNAPNRHMPLVAKLIKHGINGETEYFPSIDLIIVCRYLGVDVVKDTEVVMGKYVMIKNIPKRTIQDKNGERDIMTHPNEERKIVIPIDLYGQMDINFVGSLFCFRDDDLYDVAEWGKEYAEQYSDTIFLAAMYYATGRGASKDTHLSPYGEMSSIEHHAHAINTILNQNFLYNSKFLNLTLLFIVIFIMGYLQPLIETATFSIILASLLLLIYIGAGLVLFTNYSYIIPLSVPFLIGLAVILLTVVVFNILSEYTGKTS